ncbi:hypothetical protein BDL97_15G010200 [Sphagnum fallax]|nr:hypothetical protein BDL97_15G010200 [Sphagnum fallax]
MTVSFSKSRHRSSQSLASLSLENKVATPTTTTTYQGSASKVALVAPAAAEKRTIIAASLGESSRAAAMATHVVNGRTTTRSRRARPSSLGGSSEDFASKGLQMDQVMAATSPAEERKLTSKTSSRAPRPNHKLCSGSAPASPRPQQLQHSSAALVSKHHPQVYSAAGDERLGNQLGAAASHYVFSKTALERSFSNKSVHAKVAKADALTDQASKLQPTVASSSNSSPNSACMQDKAIVPGAEQSGQKLQQNDQEPAEDSSILQILAQNMQQDMDVTGIVPMEEDNVDKQSLETCRSNRPASADASTSKVSERQSAEGKAGNLLQTSFVTVKRTASTVQDLMNVVVSDRLEMSTEPDGADGEPSAISTVISSSIPRILHSRGSSFSLDAERCVLPLGLQKPSLILPHGNREAKPAMDSTVASLFPVEKVTEEELTEAAFLSSVGWSCKNMSMTGEKDCLEEKVCQHPLPVISSRCGSNKYMREIQYVSEVTSTRQHSVEANCFSSNGGHTNSEAEVHQQEPPPGVVESGSSVASRASNTCPEPNNRVQVPSDIIQWNKIRGRNLSRKFPGMIAVGKSGQNVLFKKQPMLDTSLVNLSDTTLSYLTDKAAVHYNLDLHPEKENMENSNNREGQRIGDVVAGVVVPGFQAFAAATQMTKKSDQSEDPHYGGLAWQEKGCQSKKAGHINLSNGTGILTSRSVCKPAPRLMLGSRTVPEVAYEKPSPPPPSSQQSNSSMSMLQLYSQQTVEEYHEAPTSFSLLGNPSFSSSHQDRIWEEQAEAYSSGGRGSPAHEDYGPGVFQSASSLAAGAISSVESLHSASGSLRKHPLEWTLTVSPSTLAAATDHETCNSSHDEKSNSKRNGRPRTPLRTLLAQDNNGKLMSGNNDIVNRSRPIGNPKRSIWSSCINCCSNCVVN